MKKLLFLVAYIPAFIMGMDAQPTARIAPNLCNKVSIRVKTARKNFRYKLYENHTIADLKKLISNDCAVSVHEFSLYPTQSTCCGLSRKAIASPISSEWTIHEMVSTFTNVVVCYKLS